MKTFNFIITLIVIITSWRCSQPINSDSKRPNILFITTDYQAYEDAPSLGLPFLDMPAYDRITKEGVVFENHYCVAPVCMPSRYSLITGQYPHTTGKWFNDSQWIKEDSPVLMKSLKKSGYETIGVGKMHFIPWDRMAGFDKRIIADRKGNWKGDDNFNDDYSKYLAKAGLSRWSYLHRQGLSDIFGVYDWPYADSLHIDHFVGEKAVEAISNTSENKPWFMWVSFNGPHNPWDPPARYTDRYRNMDLPKARWREGELENKPLDHTVLRYNYTRSVVDLIDQFPGRRDEIIHNIRAAHFGGLSFIDDQIGKVIDRLKKENKLDNTIIILSSDHGALLGDHNAIHKGSPHERSSHVPFVVWNPKRYKQKRLDGFSSHVDFAPTILSLAEAEIPAEMEGKDLTPMLLADNKSVNEYSILEIRNNTTIITKEWKMGFYSELGEWDLYDRRKDPNELVNFFDDPQYAEIKKELRQKMLEFRPTLAQDFEKNIQNNGLFQAKTIFSATDDKFTWKGPYHGGKSIEVNTTLKYFDPGNTGVIYTMQEGDTHGYSLFIQDSTLHFGIRKWNEDQVFSADIREVGNECNINAKWDKDGKATLLINGKTAARGLIDGGFPIQPGHKEFLRGRVTVGKPSRSSWFKTLGSNIVDSNYTGKISDVILQLT